MIRAIVFAAFLAATPAWAQTDEIRAIHAQMLLPAVQIESGNSRGSGTVVASKIRDGKVGTYILTNHHVIASAITLVEEYDPEKRANVKREQIEMVTVRFHRYADNSRHTGSDNRIAHIVAYDKQADLALLLLDDESFSVHVATVAPPNARLDRGERVYAVGGGLGIAPFMTEGLLGSAGHRIDGHPFIMATAAIVGGNSGGALYRKSPLGYYELIGIPSRVSVTGGMFSSAAVTHIGWHIQLDTVRAFLARHKRAYVLE